MADVETIVRDLVARVAADRGLAAPAPAQLHALNSGGANYTSTLFTASIADLKLFAKVACVGEKMRKSMNAEKLYKTEQFFYDELLKTYTALLAKHGVAKPFRVPKVYACLPDLGRETLVMEDLSAQGYATPPRRSSVDWRFAVAAVTKLALFHALSFAYEKENPKEFAAIAEMLKYESPERTPENEEIIVATWGKMVGGAVQVVRDEHKSKLKELFKGDEGFTKFKSPINRTVLVHGDYRASNLMFKEQDGNLDIIIVDYQMIHSASPVSDLLYFTFLGTDHKFRKKYYRNLMQYYHEELGSALEAFGMDVEQEYPREMFEKELKEMLPSALQMAAIILPLVTVEEGAAPKVSGDADIQGMALVPSQLFAQRFQALVQDCVDWGVL